MYARERYTECVEDREFVHTRHLIDDMLGRQERHFSSNVSLENRKTVAGDALKTLQYIVIVMRRIPIEIDWRVKLSILSICEFIGLFFSNLYGMTGDSAKTRFAVLWPMEFPNTEVKSEMLKTGWCKSEIRTIRNRFDSLQARYFVSRMDRRYLGRDHSACSEDLCSHFQINLAEYGPKHASLNCSCRSFVLPLKEQTMVCEALHKGRIPVLKIGLGEHATTMQVKDLDPDDQQHGLRYVAISHVWADGLGNPRGSELPICQVRRLAELTQNVLGEGNDVFIWLDTFCCPVEDVTFGNKTIDETRLPARHLAISMIRKTYRMASVVLVLDASLESLKLDGMPTFEPFFHIFTSGWVSRLWTLQEGITATELLFRFQDKYVRIGELIDEFRSTSRTFREWKMVLDIKSQIDWADKEHETHSGFKDLKHVPTICTELINLDHLLAYRSVSVAGDEPICISNMLQIDCDEILTIASNDPQGRMERLWQKIAEVRGGLPGNMMALPYPKLSRRGFRWAPATLLGSSGDRYDEHSKISRVNIWVSEDQIHFDRESHTFSISRSGHMLAHRHLASAEMQTLWTMNQANNIAFFQSDDGMWFSMTLELETVLHDNTKRRQQIDALYKFLMEGHLALMDMPKHRGQIVEDVHKAILGRIVPASEPIEFEVLATVGLWKLPTAYQKIYSVVRAIALSIVSQDCSANASTDPSGAKQSRSTDRLNLEVQEAVAQTLEQDDIMAAAESLTKLSKAEYEVWLSSLVKLDLMYGLKGVSKPASTCWRLV